MTRKDFELIAAVIRQGTAWERSGLAIRFADALEESNPRFDRDAFLKACQS